MIDLDVIRTGKLLGCGCSTFGGSVSKKAALQTLNFCYDNNIIYYDVARSYGYGQAESIVGELAKGKRDSIIITSKFGIEAPRSFPLKSQLMAVARMVKNNLPGSKKMLGKAAGQVLQKKVFTPEMVIQSLDKTLTELNTDYLDFYLYHESTFDEIMKDDIRAVLDNAKAKGRIRAWGANPAQQADQQKMLDNNEAADILQLPFALNELYQQMIARENQVTVVYSIMNLFRNIDADKMISLEEIKKALPGLSFVNNYQELFLYTAFHELKAGAVLMSTINQSHIMRNINIAGMDGQSPETFVKLRQLLNGSK